MATLIFVLILLNRLILVFVREINPALYFVLLSTLSMAVIPLSFRSDKMSACVLCLPLCPTM